MTENFAPGEQVTFLVVQGNGEVREATQRILCDAPVFAGMRSWWTEQGVLITRASRRYPTGVLINNRWKPTSGLTIEKGDVFTETDVRSKLMVHVRKMRGSHERLMRAWGPR